MMKKIKKTTNLYIDGTNLFAGQNDLFGPRQYLDFDYLPEPSLHKEENHSSLYPIPQTEVLVESSYDLLKALANSSSITHHYPMAFCPDCKQVSLVHEGGCQTCQNCGYSAC